MCEQSTQVHRFHDGYLTAQARDEIEAHLAECSECAELLKELRGLSRVIAAAPRATLPPEALERLRESRQVVRDRSVLRIASWLTAAAACITLATLLIKPSQQIELRGGTATASLWQTRAVTPPDEMDSGSAELVVVAQWMADELGSEGR